MTVFEVTKLVRVVDGDTVRFLTRHEIKREVLDLGSGEELITVTYRADRAADAPDGYPYRLTTLDTPEKKGATLAEAKRAQADQQLWWDTQRAAGRQIYARLYAGGGFDRTLADVFVLEDPLSLSEWMLQRGWAPYVKGQ